MHWIASESICRGIECNMPCFFAWVHLRDWTSSRVIRLSEVRRPVLTGIFIWRRAQAVAQHFDVHPSWLAILPCQRVGVLVFFSSSSFFPSKINGCIYVKRFIQCIDTVFCKSDGTWHARCNLSQILGSYLTYPSGKEPIKKGVRERGAKTWKVIFLLLLFLLVKPGR